PYHPISMHHLNPSLPSLPPQVPISHPLFLHPVPVRLKLPQGRRIQSPQGNPLGYLQHPLYKTRVHLITRQECRVIPFLCPASHCVTFSTIYTAFRFFVVHNAAQFAVNPANKRQHIV